jgi:hypothetical protein
VGHWARIDDKDYIISTLAAPGGSGDVDVVLYDPDDPSSPINLTGSRPSQYSLGWIGFDPAADEGNGQYTLVTVETSDTGRTFLAVFQRDGINWVFRYEFAAEVADPTLTGLGFHVTSPEPFEYGDFLYIVFVVADEPDFGSSTVGKIMLTRVESNDPTPQDHRFRILSCAGPCEETVLPIRKRIEPEVHFMPMHYPAVYYTEVAGANDADGCPEHQHKLMRALMGQPWTD